MNGCNYLINWIGFLEEVNSTLLGQLTGKQLLNGFHFIEEVLVLLYKPGDRNESLGIGVSILSNQIRFDSHILNECPNPDIVSLLYGRERKTITSRDCDIFGEIDVSSLK